MSDNVHMREISDKKIEKNAEIRKKWFIRRINKYEKEITDDLNHNVLLIGDSKVRHLENEMTAKTNLTAFWRSGGKLDNVMLKRHIDRHISHFNQPIVVLYFNTCYLTDFITGSRKYVDLVENSDTVVNRLVDTYMQFKQDRLYRKPSIKLIYLECPYYSIVDWNRQKGHPQPESFANNQVVLEKLIDELNLQIKEINLPFYPPRLAQDMIIKIKKRTNHAQTKRIDYSVLKDGIHPDKTISKLWLIRINNFVTSLNK